MSGTKAEGLESQGEGIEAVIGKVRGNAENRFAVAYPTRECDLLPRDTDITFSLSDWEGGAEPLKGQVVLLMEVQRFIKGWRARRARPVELTPARSREPQGG